LLEQKVRRFIKTRLTCMIITVTVVF